MEKKKRGIDKDNWTHTNIAPILCKNEYDVPAKATYRQDKKQAD